MQDFVHNEKRREDHKSLSRSNAVKIENYLVSISREKSFPKELITDLMKV